MPYQFDEDYDISQYLRVVQNLNSRKDNNGGGGGLALLIRDVKYKNIEIPQTKTDLEI